MEFNKDFYMGVIVGIFVFFLYTMFTKRKASQYTVQDFPDTLSLAEADAQFKKETSEIATELSQKLSEGINSNASNQDLINITWTYADNSNQLNKNYAAYKIRNRPPPPPAPSSS